MVSRVPPPAAVSRVPPPAAVLWDMDGTLVDTEQYWMAEEHDLVGRYGGIWTDDHARALVGNDLLVSARYIIEHGRLPMDPQQVVHVLLAGVVRRMRVHVPWRPGARELLEALGEAGVPCALVTMSWTSLADAFLAELPAGTFAAVVTGDAVEHGLRAAQLLGVPPAACLAIEDSPTGVASAEAAGVPVLAVPHIVPIPPAPGRSRATSLTEVSPDDLARIMAGEIIDTVADPAGEALPDPAVDPGLTR
jgi:HAD superfamily hydrolase (TIGR01509 family)